MVEIEDTNAVPGSRPSAEHVHANPVVQCVLVAVVLLFLLAIRITAQEGAVAMLLPTTFGGHVMTVEPGFLPQGLADALMDSAAAKWEDAQHKAGLFVVRCDSPAGASVLLSVLSEVMLETLSKDAWLPQWLWVPRSVMVDQVRLTTKWAEGMGYGFPTCVGIAYWADDRTGFGVFLCGPADEYDRETLVSCARAWIRHEELSNMPVRDSADPESPFALFRNARELLYFDPGASLRLAESSLGRFAEAKSPLWASAARLLAGMACAEGMDLSEADAYLNGALQEFGSQGSANGRLSALLSIAATSYRQGRLEDALALVAAALLSIAEEGRVDSILDTDALTLQACIHFTAGLWQLATTEFTGILHEDQLLQDMSRTARDLNNLAVAALARADYMQAFRLLGEAQSTRPYVSMPISVILWEDARALLPQKQLPSAETTEELTLPLTLMLEGAQLYEIEMNVVAAYVQVGLLDKAEELLDYLIGAEEIAIQIRGAATSWLSLVSHWCAASVVDSLRGRPASALEKASRAMAYADQYEWMEPRLYTRLQVARLAIAGGAEWREVCEQGLADSFAPTDSSAEKAHTILAGGAVATILDEDIVWWNYAWQFAAVVGEAYATQGDFTEALNSFQASLGILNRAFRKGVTGAESAAAVWPMPWRGPFESAIKVLAAEGEAEKSLLVAEDSRSKTLLELMQSAVVGGRSYAPSSADTPLDLEDAAAMMTGREALIEYFVGPEEVYAWVMAGGDVRGPVVMPYVREALLGDVYLARTLIEADSPTMTQRAQLTTTLGSLYERLVAPVVPLIGDAATLVIVPSGPLWYLPFSALVRTDKPCIQSGNDLLATRPWYLIDSYAIAYVPSIGTLALLTGGESRPVAGTLTAFANPALSAEQTERLGVGTTSLEDLEQSVRGFSACIAPGGQHILTQFAATESRIPEAIAESDVVVFACHGLFSAANPVESCLYLAADGNQDGVYTASEVFSCDYSSASLVVLAACETLLPSVEGMYRTPWELARLTTGDEVVGLTRAFLAAGADAVLGTLWKACAKPAARLLPTLCPYYLLGLSWAQALQKAQLDLIALGYSDPWYWAPYQLVGLWR